MIDSLGQAELSSTVEVKLIDTDIHLEPRSVDDVISRMPSEWRSRLWDHRRLAVRQVYVPLGHGQRLDSYAAEGPAGSDLGLVDQQLFVEEGADFAINGPVLGRGVDPGFNSAVTSALNTWQAETWLAERPGRLFGSICVPLDDLTSSVSEVEKWAGHPGFKQILIGADSDRPLGHPRYDPLWSVASSSGLPVAIHFNETNSLVVGLTPVGHFIRQVDHHALAHPLEYAAHLASWICEGTFTRFPELRFVFLEGGFLWSRPLVRRLAYRWREKTGHLGPTRKDPFECLREHVRFSSQPMEDPEDREDLATMLVDAEADKLLMFSSDYPHYDYDAPAKVLPRNLPPSFRKRVLSENAREWYNLPAERPLDGLDRARIAER